MQCIFSLIVGGNMDFIIDFYNSMTKLWNYLFDDNDDPIDEIYVSEFVIVLFLTIVMVILYGFYATPIKYVITSSKKICNIEAFNFKIERRGKI